jgi:uncharacterized protein YjbI with pentapeptide repeats
MSRITLGAVASPESFKRTAILLAIEGDFVTRVRASRHVLALVLAIAAASTVGTAHVRAQQLQAGTNVNVVGGPACSNDPNNPFYAPDCPAKVFGDLTVQRQNEGSMDCSSRNTANCLAAGNDYRLIGVTGPQDGKVTGDAWMGIYWTHNGGTTWRSSLLPGWKSGDPSFVDDTPAGLASPLSGLEAAADATVRAGTHGLFYVSGVAFNRAGEQNGAGTIGKTGVMFVSTYIDDNNTSDPNHGPRYLRTAIVDSGTNGQFLDKPWIAVDIPRGLASCTIAADPGLDGAPGTPDDIPAQTIAAGMVYSAYSTFLGSGNNPHTDIWFRSSNNCGATWSNATKLTASIPLGQSAIIAIGPTGDIWVSWREFGLSGNSDKIWAARSTNGGKMFSKSVVVADLGVPAPTSSSYDPETLPNDANLNLREARSHDFPALCVGSDNVARVAFSKRNASGWARIMMTTSSNWAALAPIDAYAGAGHQFQPTLVCTGTQTTAAWYDERNDNAFTLGNIPYVLTPFIIDPDPPPPVHTIDVRAAQTPKTGGAFDPSIQVSHYPIRYNAPNSPTFLQLKYNFLNLPLFGGGKLPFIGDYIDILAKNKFTPPLGANGWTFNDYANETPNLNVVWTDNRDVLQISSLQGDDNQAIAGSVNAVNFQAFAAPGTAACTAPSLTVTRNQNLYTALLGRGLLTQVDGNARRTPSLKLRAYVVALYNFTRPVAGPDGLFGTPDDIKQKRFKLSFVAGGGAASFGFDPQTFGLDLQATQLFVALNSFSGTARTVFVPKDSTAAVIVQVTEVDANGGAIANGLQARAVIAPDPNAPTQPLPDEDHSASLDQVFFSDGQNTFTTINYTPLQISSNTILGNENLFSAINLGDINLGDINLGDINLGDINLGDINLGDINLGDINLGDINLGDINLGDINLGDINLGDINLGDTPIATKTVLTTTNNGNVDASYDLDALIQNLPTNAVMQVLVSRLLTVPTPEDCTQIANRAVLRTLSSASSTTGTTNSSFSLPPGGVGVITLQATCNRTENPDGCFTGANLSAIVRQQAPNCTATGCTPLGNNVFDTAPPVLSLPADSVTPATSGAGAVVTFNPAPASTDFVDGSITPICTPASGSTFPVGTTTVNCTATDAHGNTATGSFTVTVTNAAPVANGQSVAVNEDSVGNSIVLTGSDLENEPLMFTVLTQPSHGTLTGEAPNLTYAPASNYNGADSFTFKVNDGADSNTATVSITVNAVNDAPVANGQTVTTNEDTPVAVVLTGTDVETPSGSLIFQVTAPAHGSLSGSAPNLTYTPAANYNGSDSFTFTVTDTGDGASGALTSAAATVTITVNAVNDAPVAASQAVTTAEDSAIGITLSATDVDSASLTYSIVSGPAHGGLAGTPPSVTYTPAADYFGSDSFTFKANDGSLNSNVATVSITVNPVNDPPVANPDAATATAGGTIAISVLANDTDVDDATSTLTVGAITASPSHGTAVISADGKTINYTANATFAGSDTFQYTAKDPSGALSAPATVTVANNFGFNGLLNNYQPPPKSYNLGGSFPVVWQYTNASGQVIDSSGLQPILYVRFTQVIGANANTCLGGTETGVVLTNADFPGNSNFQYFTVANPHPTAGANTWQFNWKMVSPVTAGCWKIRVILDLNNNTVLGDAGDQVNKPDGFLIKVK